MDGPMAPGMLSSLCDMLKPPDEDSDSDEDKVATVFLHLSPLYNTVMTRAYSKPFTCVKINSQIMLETSCTCDQDCVKCMCCTHCKSHMQTLWSITSLHHRFDPQHQHMR